MGCLDGIAGEGCIDDVLQSAGGGLDQCPSRSFKNEAALPGRYGRGALVMLLCIPEGIDACTNFDCIRSKVCVGGGRVNFNHWWWGSLILLSLAPSNLGSSVSMQRWQEEVVEKVAAAPSGSWR